MDPNTPLEETMGALRDIVRMGKALYVGISNYDAPTTKRAYEILKDMGIKPIIHQMRFSMLDRHVQEQGIIETTHDLGMGSIVFSPLEQGILSDKYLNGIPKNSRAAKSETFLTEDKITDKLLEKVKRLNEIAGKRGQSLSQMAISWLLGVGNATSVLVGASNAEQIRQNVKAIENVQFSNEEKFEIEKILEEQTA